MAQLERGEIVVKVKADVDEAVAGLKRLQRVARETVQELREAESLTINGKFDLSGVSTKELVDELAQRDGIELIRIGYYDHYDVRHYFNEQWLAKSDPHYRSAGMGPAEILINRRI